MANRALPHRINVIIAAVWAKVFRMAWLPDT
jgi:hypothetical protein